MKKNPEHELGVGCWCTPYVLKICTQCEGNEESECWCCDGSGCIEVDNIKDADVIVHKNVYWDKGNAYLNVSVEVLNECMCEDCQADRQDDEDDDCQGEDDGFELDLN